MNTLENELNDKQGMLRGNVELSMRSTFAEAVLGSVSRGRCNIGPVYI